MSSILSGRPETQTPDSESSRISISWKITILSFTDLKPNFPSSLRIKIEGDT